MVLVGELLEQLLLAVDARAWQRVDAQVDLAELAAAAGLLLVAVVGLGLGRDRLAVGDLRLLGDDFQVEAALEPVLDHVQVQLAHAGDDHLLGLACRA